MIDADIDVVVIVSRVSGTEAEARMGAAGAAEMSDGGNQRSEKKGAKGLVAKYPNNGAVDEKENVDESLIAIQIDELSHFYHDVSGRAQNKNEQAGEKTTTVTTTVASKAQRDSDKLHPRGNTLVRNCLLDRYVGENYWFTVGLTDNKSKIRQELLRKVTAMFN